MELLNATQMEAGYTLGLDPDGRERIVVVVKGTFELPAHGSPLTLAAQQVPLVMADEFPGEPGLSATVHVAAPSQSSRAVRSARTAVFSSAAPEPARTELPIATNAAVRSFRMGVASLVCEA